MSDIILNVQNVTKRFGGLTAVNEVSLQVREGSIHALIGPNGSGKSTLLNLINGIYRLDGGQIHFNGSRIDGLAPYQVARLGIGRTFQNIRLFHHLTVLQNVMVGQHYRYGVGFLPTVLKTPFARQREKELTQKALETLEFLGLKDAADVGSIHLPYGQRRMVEIARALVMEPRLLILDEPAAGLNPTETITLMERLRQINKRGISILLVEHNMRFVMDISESITVLDFGRVICEGNPDYVKGDSKVIEAYLGSQNNYEFAETSREVAQ